MCIFITKNKKDSYTRSPSIHPPRLGTRRHPYPSALLMPSIVILYLFFIYTIFILLHIV